MSTLLLFKHMGGVMNKERFIEEHCPNLPLYWIPEYIHAARLKEFCVKADSENFALVTLVSATSFETILKDEFQDSAGNILSAKGVKLMELKISTLLDLGFSEVGNGNFVRMPNVSVKRYETNGDNYLSANDCHIWSLFYSVILKYSCPIMFKDNHCDVPRGIDRVIEFYVPRNHEHCKVVVEYLNQELKGCVHSGSEPGFNTEVHVYEFSGVQTYVEQEDLEEIVKGAMNKFKNMFNSENRTIN